MLEIIRAFCNLTKLFRIQFDYDFRDSSLEDGKLNECLKETSSEELVGGFKRELDHESLNSDQGASFLKKEDVVRCAANGDSPFSVDVTFYEGGEVICRFFASFSEPLISAKIFCCFLLYG